MDQTQAQFLAQCLCKLWEGEFPATCKVLAAVPNDKHSYRPDEKSRTAWELATHIATADLWFINCILAGSFSFDAGGGEEAGCPVWHRSPTSSSSTRRNSPRR